MMILDRLKGITLSDEQRTPFFNEIFRLNQLAAGLAFLYATVRGFEEAHSASGPRVSFSLGNSPSMPGLPRPLILCMFQWYAISVCNLTRLIGLIAHEAPPPKRTVEDLGAAFDVLRSKSGEREARFREQMQAEGQKGKLLDRKFQEGLEKAKDSPDPPKRPFDFD